MSELTDKIQTFVKEKPALAGAIAIGGIGGLYLLSRSGGSGLSAVSAPATDPTAAAQQAAAQQQGGGSNNDIAALANQVAEQASQNQSFQAKIQDSLASLVSQFNNALSQVAGQNQSGLNALAQQTNQALGGLSQQQGSGFTGFDSQLVRNLQAEIDAQIAQVRAASTGYTQQYMTPSIIPLPAPKVNSITPAQINQAAFNLGALGGSVIKLLGQSAPKAPAIPVVKAPTANQLNQFAYQIGQLSGSLVKAAANSGVQPSIVKPGTSKLVNTQ